MLEVLHEQEDKLVEVVKSINVLEERGQSLVLGLELLRSKAFLASEERNEL